MSLSFYRKSTMSIEETLSNGKSAVKLQGVEKALSLMESKRKKLTDMFLDDKITKGGIGCEVQ